jgi:hypothetical protein
LFTQPISILQNSKNVLGRKVKGTIVKPSAEEIPEGFTGLLYAPSSENAVYLLLGLLLPHVPHRFAFEEFEIDPIRHGYFHRKYLDARGKHYAGGQWKDATFEFKLFSSSFFRDIKENHGIHVDFLICWDDDAGDLSDHVEHVICFRKIFEKLPRELQESFILYPNKIGKLPASAKEVGDLLKRFSDTNRIKVERLILKWPHQTKGGEAEILFVRGLTTYMNACAYTTQHIGEYSGRSRPPIPIDSGHRFRGKAATPS